MVIRSNIYHIKAGHGSTGGIGAVGRIRNNDLRPSSVTAAFMPCFNQQKTGEFPMGTGSWLKGTCLHSGNLAQCFLYRRKYFQTALDILSVLQWVDVCKSVETGDGIVDLRIVFHGAGAKRIKPIINAMGLLCQISIVTAQLCLGYLRQMQIFFSERSLESNFRCGAGRDEITSSSGGTHFKYQSHASTSFMTERSPSISERVFISVVHQSISLSPVTRPER